MQKYIYIYIFYFYFVVIKSCFQPWTWRLHALRRRWSGFVAFLASNLQYIFFLSASSFLLRNGGKNCSLSLSPFVICGCWIKQRIFNDLTSVIYLHTHYKLAWCEISIFGLLLVSGKSERLWNNLHYAALYHVAFRSIFFFLLFLSFKLLKKPVRLKWL